MTVVSEFIMGTLFLIQTGIGLLGNSLLLYFHVLMFFTKRNQRPADLILNHLTIGNFLVLFSGVIPQTLTAFGLKYFMVDVGCRLSFYIHRVGRGISLCTTCLLSGFQAVTISPSNSKWAEFKLRIPKFVKVSCFQCWILHFLINIIVPMTVTSQRNATNIIRKDFGLCSGKGIDSFTKAFHAFLFLLFDALFLGPMVWTSSSIVLFLQRHKQRLQYIRHASLSPRTSPETKATHTVLFLVSSFVFFYSLSSLLSFYMTHFINPSLQLVHICSFLTACFPVLSPLVLISQDSRIFGFYVSCLK